ncbi:hypothetical protein MSAN_02343700 [Mycena sanguinolenta]|uniref:F-box domain-containing protein n=1 Tax=Mycena sanguinolenta TaxID=230812 RepID=A0A8H6X7C2_9AGAR|nr:hypothetical protein MSAN_02343700 [Mycena sanguinolenta]
MTLLRERDTSTTHQNNCTLFSMRAVVLEQRERTRKSSKADIERFIEESESKITSLDSQINALVNLRDRERTYVAALRYLISPIHTLPVELLARIFELAIRDYMHVWDVFRISQVCSDWREVAHSTPRLWTRPMRIDLRKDRSGDQEKIYTDGLKTWLTCSAPFTVPISVVLIPMSSRRLTEQILGTAPRWRSLQLIYPPPWFISQLAEASMHNLEELDLGIKDGNFHNYRTEDFDLFKFTTVPRLRRLCLHINSNTLSILVPAAQLTDLILNVHCSNIALDILAQCTNLIHAALRTTGMFSRPHAIQTVPTLSHLRVLSLRFFGSEEHAMSFLDHLPTPALEELSLDFDDASNPSWSEVHFIAFQRQAPNITQLKLWWSRLTSDELRSAICHAPSLTHLELISCHACFDDVLISALCYKPGASPLAPHLHHLRLDDVGDKFTPNVLADMIVSRWRTGDELVPSHRIPPPVPHWTRVEFSGGYFGPLNGFKDLPSNVLIY